MVKNTISLGQLYGSNHQVWDTVKGKNTLNKECPNKSVCLKPVMAQQESCHGFSSYEIYFSNKTLFLDKFSNFI